MTTAPRTTLIVNPHAGSADDSVQTLSDCAERHGWDVRATRAAGHGVDLAERAAAGGAERVFAAGGDGTVSEVVTGLMRADVASRPTFGLLPLGTGNDFARTLCMQGTIPDLCERLAAATGPTGHADLLRICAGDDCRWALNVVNGGIAHAVNERLDDDQKRRWGALSFALGGLELAGQEVPTWQVRYQLDDGPWQTVDGVTCLAVANAATAGGGFRIAPGADIEDGRFDLVLIRAEDRLALMEVAARAPFGALLQSDHVTHARGQRLRAQVPGDFVFRVDGEALPARPEVEVDLLCGALPFIAGPGYGQPSAA